MLSLELRKPAAERENRRIAITFKTVIVYNSNVHKSIQSMRFTLQVH